MHSLQDQCWVLKWPHAEFWRAQTLRSGSELQDRRVSAASSRVQLHHVCSKQENDTSVCLLYIMGLPCACSECWFRDLDQGVMGNRPPGSHL